MVRVQFEQCGLPFAFAIGSRGSEAARALRGVNEPTRDEARDGRAKLDGGEMGGWRRV